MQYRNLACPNRGHQVSQGIIGEARRCRGALPGPRHAHVNRVDDGFMHRKPRPGFLVLVEPLGDPEETLAELSVDADGSYWSTAIGMLICTL